MADDVRVRVAGRSFGYQGETYEHDEELEVSESTAEKHPRTLEVIESGSSEGETSEESVEGATESDYEYEICGAEIGRAHV